MSTESVNYATERISEVSTCEMLKMINDEDKKVPEIVEGCIPEIARLVEEGVTAIRGGNRIIYCGAGTSGRLGIVDAAECPPTYGISHECFSAVIAGGKEAVFRAAEGCEDSREKGVAAFSDLKCKSGDFVIGLSVSGQAPFVCAFMEEAKKNGCVVGAIVNNRDCPMDKIADITVFADTGAEAIKGSTRMKGGTSQKLILNMFSTAVCIKLGYVYKNFMVNMKVSNSKLERRAVAMIVEITEVSETEAKEFLVKNDWVIRDAIKDILDRQSTT